MSETSVGEFLAALVVTIAFTVVLMDAPDALGIPLDPVLGELLALVAALVCTFIVFFGYYRVRSSL